MDKHHKKIKVWPFAMEKVTNVHRLTESFPSEEKFDIF